MTDLDQITTKLDIIINALGLGKGKLASEIKREAQAKVLQLEARRRKKGHGGAATQSK